MVRRSGRYEDGEKKVEVVVVVFIVVGMGRKKL
jgi:hypothetical protein